MLALALSLHLLNPGAPAAPRLRLAALEAEAPPALVDPHQGGVAAPELSAALGGVLIGEAGSFGLALAMDALFTDRSTDFIQTTRLISLGAVSHVLLTPLLAATLARLAVREPHSGSLGQAYRNALLCRLAMLAPLTLAYFLGGDLVGNAVGPLLAIYLAADLLLLPLGASLGLHSGTAPPQAEPEPAPAPPPAVLPGPDRAPEFEPPPRVTLGFRF